MEKGLPPGEKGEVELLDLWRDSTVTVTFISNVFKQTATRTVYAVYFPQIQLIAINHN